MRVKLLAITAIISGVLVLLGWFTLPMRVSILAIGVIVVFRFLLSSFRAKRGISHESTAVPIGEIPRRNLGMTSGAVAIVAAAIAAALLLWHSGTTDPLRSPWSVVPVPFFFLYAMIGVFSARGAVPVLWRGCASGAGISITLALSSLVAILVYPLGFGFDHFIHAAAEHIIATTGTLSPPPLFYSAHYGLTILLADLLPGVGVDLADRLLAPLLTVALLVPLAYRTLHSILPERATRLGLSSLLIVPFLPLAVSTPQATANVFALATILTLILTPPPLAEGERPVPTGASGEGVYTQTRDWGMRGWSTPLATALAALLSQPMTGIITIAIVAIAFVRRWLTKKTRSRFFGQFLSSALTAAVAAAGAVAIPLAFAIAGRIIPGLDLRVAFDPLPALQRLGHALSNALSISAADFATADALEVARLLLPLLWVGLTAVGAIRLVAWKSEENHSLIRANRRIVRGTLILAPLISLLAAMAVASTVTVPTLLGEEQSQFPLRLVSLAALLATPLAAIGLGTLLERVRGRRPQIAAAIAVGAAATFTLLLAYPRDDAQARSGLWSVSADDIAAVHAIANDAGDTPYVVLANQMLAAAAIREFGFRPAHHLSDGNETLAFPLPAGGPIARKYWEYVSQDIECLSPSFRGGAGGGACPHRQPIDAAMDLVGTQRAYVVLHDYWRNYERLAAATAAIADVEVGSFRHLRVFVFFTEPR